MTPPAASWYRAPRVRSPETPSSVLALAEFARKGVRAKLLVIAKLFTKGSGGDAVDLIAVTMMVVLDPAQRIRG